MSTPPTPSAPSDTIALLREWSRLTRAETAAIAAQDWEALRGHQEEKAALQQRLDQVLSTPSDTPAAPQAVRQLVGELYALEHENRTQLTLKIRKVKDQLATEDRSIHTLGQVRKAYAGTSHSSWGTYS